MTERALLARVVRLLDQGRTAAALAALRHLGARYDWAAILLRRTLAAGSRRAPAAPLVRTMLVQSLKAYRAVPVNSARFAAAVRANHTAEALWPIRVADFLEALLSWAARWATGAGGAVGLPDWLRFPVAGVLVVLVILLLGRAGRLIPIGMRFHAESPNEERRLTPDQLWSAAMAAWSHGDPLGALRLGRAAVLTRREGPARNLSQASLTDREREAMWPSETRLAFRTFRTAYAEARWAARPAAVERAWATLSQLWGDDV